MRLVSRSANDLTGLLLCQRKAMAQRLVAELTPSAHLSARFEAGSARVMREMSARGLEGLIAKQNWPRTSRAPGGGSLRLVRCGFAPGWSRSEGEKPAEMVREQPQ